MACGSKGTSALTEDSWGVTAGSAAGTAGIGAGIEMGLAGMGCGLCIRAGNGGGGGGGGLFSSKSILLEGTAGTACSLAKSILKLGDTMVGLAGAGMNLSFSASE